ncbi:MAG: TonB-dependent receptor [Candidatus Acidiferrales bacterium]
MKSLFRAIFLLAAILMLSGRASLAQGVGSSGQIQGTVTDPTGGVVSSVSVTATDMLRGLTYTAATNAAGQYQFAGLPPSTYNVTAKANGFQTQTQTGLALTVGQLAVIDFKLAVATSSTQVEVTAEPPVIETERGSQADTVTQRYIEDLPISRRDYLTFTLLMPGVSNSNVIASNADFRVQQTPQSGLSFYGSNGRGNNVTVDGGEANDDAGGVRLTLSQDAVQEFQVNRSNYNADLGAASGATINIVSKSGTNEIHGGLFGFFRNDGLDARDPFSFAPALSPGDPFSLDAVGAPVKDTLNRQQFGGTLGFPIHKDRTFAFIGFEGLRSDAQDSVPLLTNSNIFAPTTGQQSIIGGLETLPGNPMVPCFSDPANPESGPPTFLPAQTCGFLLGQCLTITPTASSCPVTFTNAVNPFIINQFETQGGLFPFPQRSYATSFRLDHRIDDSNQLAFRYSYVHDNEQNPNLQALTAYSRGTRVNAWDSTAMGSWYHQFNPTTQNEAHFQWGWSYLGVDTTDPGGPGLDIEGYGFFGRQIFLPSFTTTRRYEFADNVTFVRGHHTIKTGFYELIRGNSTTSETFFAGRFEFLDLPGFILSPCLYVPTDCGLPTTGAAQISTLQSASLGLPSFYEQGFGNPTYAFNRPFTAAYVQDTWQVRPGLTLNLGIRYDLDSQTSLLHTTKDNFGPRISFAWSPFNDNKTVVRGGFGIFYSPIYAQIDNVVKTLGDVNGTRQIANTLVTLNGLNGSSTTPPNPAVNSALLYQALFAQGKVQCGTPPAGQNACISETDLANLGVQVSNTGPLPPGVVLFYGQKNFKNPYSEQASFGIEHQFGSTLTVSASYIYVHTLRLPVSIDTNILPGAPVTAGVGANGLPTNPNYPFQNWGGPGCVNAYNQPSGTQCWVNPYILQNNQYSSIASALYQGGLFEMRKRFGDHFTMLANYTFSKAFDDSTDFNSDYAPFNETQLYAERALSDFDQRNKVVVAGVFDSPWENSKILKGFQLSPIFNYNSGHPFNLLAGSDINGDNHFTNDRPPGAGRNSGLGPNFISFDMRLSKTFRFHDKYGVELMAEGFNIANHTNYASVNNIVGADFAPPFDVHGTAALGPSQPLGFTAALPKRQIQLGARFSF